MKLQENIQNNILEECWNHCADLVQIEVHMSFWMGTLASEAPVGCLMVKNYPHNFAIGPLRRVFHIDLRVSCVPDIFVQEWQHNIHKLSGFWCFRVSKVLKWDRVAFGVLGYQRCWNGTATYLRDDIGGIVLHNTCDECNNVISAARITDCIIRQFHKQQPLCSSLYKNSNPIWNHIYYWSHNHKRCSYHVAL